MNTFGVRTIRSLAAIAAVAVLSLAGIAPASATTAQDCKTNYQTLGFSSPSDCISTLSSGRPKHR